MFIDQYEANSWKLEGEEELEIKTAEQLAKEERELENFEFYPVNKDCKDLPF